MKRKAKKNAKDTGFKTYFYKFKYILYISRHKDIKPNFLTDVKSKKIQNLFNKLEEIKTVAFKNHTTLGLMGVLYLTTVAVGLYIFLSLHEKPYEYGIYCPIFIWLFITYYVMFFLCLYKFEHYRDVLNVVLNDYEDKNDCKIRIRRHKKGFEINWEASKTELDNSKVKKSKKGKIINKAKKNKDESFEDIEIDNQKFSKFSLKGTKPKLSKNKILPKNSKHKKSKK